MDSVLFAGASSFTGFYFAKALAERGFKVHALFQKERDAYSGLRKKRVEALLPFVTPHFNSSIQHPPKGSFDLFAFHAASTDNYKSISFDPLKEAEKVVRNLPVLLKQVRRVLFTGTLFQRHGQLEALSPYGVSKTVIYEILRFWCDQLKVPLREFYIPQPFGIFEEPRLPTYLIETWKRGECAELKECSSEFDFIPAPLLASAYASEQITFPSYFRESVLDFANRFGKEMQKQLDLDPKVHGSPSLSLPPRFGKEPLNPKEFDFDEENFWKEYAEWYRTDYL